ncbi:MAG: roadblock/LC7 domain-containing protein [Verrucomicrobia bacterium]|nr:roadblock/LC7 domain-containing protein [Verrucomicrobiota bacterium]
MFGFVKTWLRKPEEQKNQSALRPAAAVTHAPRRSVPAVEVLELPLAAIFGRLPADLQGRVKLPLNGQAQVAVPVGMILPQMGRGSVKITFGELRGMAGDVFYSQTDRDAAIVELPLGEILSRLDPALLPRRAQSAVAVPADITSPFAEKGRGLNLYKPVAPAPAASVRKPDESVIIPEYLQRGPAAVAPAADEVPPVPPPVAPAPIPMPAALHKEVAHTAVPAAAPAREAGGGVLPVALGELVGNWPATVRMEIMQIGLSHATVALPAAQVEEALRKGRAVFPWRQVRSWINSPGAASASAHDAELVELPLKVIAPLFLARQRVARPQTRLAVDKNIPDLFAAIPPKPVAAPEPAAPAAPAAPKPETIVFSDTEISGKARMTDNARSGTEFLKRYATPNDIVVKAAALEGVLGALITLADGLLVASQLPASVNGDSLAAFTPQLYTRVSQSAREYRMGELKDLTFTVGNTNWKIFKVGSIFFAVFGNADKPLPGAQLATLAAELDRKPKP